jgi:hypothetical protein
VASADRVPASLLPGCSESSEEENEHSEQEPGKQSVVGPGHFRQEKVDIGGSSSVHVEVHIPRHEEDKGHARQAEPENKQERKQEGLEREIPPPLVGAPDASLFENTVFQGIETLDPEIVAPGRGRVKSLFGPRMQVEEYALQAEWRGQQGAHHYQPYQKNDQ